jgi:hypothetical protein
MRKPGIRNAKPARESSLDLRELRGGQDLLVSKLPRGLRAPAEGFVPKRRHALSAQLRRALWSAGTDAPGRYGDPQGIPDRSEARASAKGIRSARGTRSRAESFRGLRTPRERQRSNGLRFSAFGF